MPRPRKTTIELKIDELQPDDVLIENVQGHAVLARKGRGGTGGAGGGRLYICKCTGYAYDCKKTAEGTYCREVCVAWKCERIPPRAP